MVCTSTVKDLVFWAQRIRRILLGNNLAFTLKQQRDHTKGKEIIMKKKVYPLYYGGKKQRFARSVVSGGGFYGMSGRLIETGEVSSNDVTEQTKVALDKIKLAWRNREAAWSIL